LYLRNTNTNPKFHGIALQHWQGGKGFFEHLPATTDPIPIVTGMMDLG
jgi:hypothetical protein